MEQSFFKKIGVIAALVIVLAIPLQLILNTVQERSYRNDAAFRDIAATWGQAQIISGPVLTVPYFDGEGETAFAYFLADSVDVVAELAPEKRYRGIFEVIVYRSDLTITGAFSRPDFSQWGIEDFQIQWDKASVTLAMENLRGIQEVRAFQWNGHAAQVRPGQSNSHGIYGLTGFVGGEREPGSCPADACFPETARFSISLSVHGSRQMNFAPTAGTTRVTVNSTWEHPSFNGHYLPFSRTISQDGFTAKWRIASFGRHFPGQWRSGDKMSKRTNTMLTSQRFGVELMQPVNFYTKSERSVKYGLLIISLTFLCFFMFEIMNRLEIHPMQYLLVGVGLSLFYLLLISFAEHVGFLPAYLVSSAACITLITWYTTYFLTNRAASLITGGVLTAFFTLFYIILQHEGYSLVIGSSSLFLILAFVMWMTRHLDWNAVFENSVRMPRNPFKFRNRSKKESTEGGAS